MNTRLAVLALATPMLLFLLAFFYAPLVYVVFYSLTTSDDPLSAYVEALARPEYLGVTIYSAVNALIVAAASTLLAAPAAYYVASLGDPRVKAMILAVLVAPFWVDVLLRTLSLKALLLLAGVGEGYLPMMIGLVYEYIPISLITGYVAFTRTPGSLVEAARTLGATPIQAAIRVVVPLASPWLAAGAAMVFLMALTDYVVPGLLGGTQGFTIGTLLYYLFLAGDRWDVGSALASMLTLATVLGAAIAFKRMYEVTARA